MCLNTTTFTALKLPVEDNGVFTGFSPHLTSLSDYYPFGSGMEGRTVTEGYRYGFNAMEREDELYAPGSAYDFGARMYDGRLGRWWSVDPLAGNYADVATYSAFGNSPIYFLDPDGRKLKGYSETDAAKLGIVIQTVLSEYQVVAAFFTVNYETHEFNPVDMEALYSELGKIDNADARAVAYTLAKAINSDVTYEVAFVEDNQDILLISRANYGTGKELDAVNGGGVIQVDPRSFRVLLNEESIGRSEDLMMYLGDANVLNDGSIRRSPSVEAASIGGIILSMYNSSEPFMTSKVPLQEDGKLSKLQQGVKMVQTQNVVERLIKGVELRGLMRFGGTVNKEVLSDNTTPDEQLPVFGSNPRTLAPYQERDLNP